MNGPQQINLYQDEFRKRETTVSARQVSLGAVLLIVILGLISAFKAWQQQGLELELNELKQQHAGLNSRLAALRKQLEAGQADPQLQQKAEALARDLAVKQQVMQVLSGKEFGNTEGFVPHFTGLARQRIDGLWLTALTIQQGGTSLDMQGTSLKPEYVPRYLQRLSAEPVFAGTEFHSMVISENEKRRNRVDFSLESEVKKVAGQ